MTLVWVVVEHFTYFLLMVVLLGVPLLIADWLKQSRLAIRRPRKGPL